MIYKINCGEKTADTENEGVINRYISKNETETNRDPLKKVTKQLPYDLCDKEGGKQQIMKMKL